MNKCKGYAYMNPDISFHRNSFMILKSQKKRKIIKNHLSLCLTVWVPKHHGKKEQRIAYV